MDEKELVRRVAEGDEAAFEELYRTHKAPVANLLYRLCFDRELVNDLLQEVFLRVWRGCRTFRAESKLSTFIFRIAYNVWVNDARRRHERPVGEPAERVETTEPAHGIEARERDEQVREAIRSLPPRDRTVLILSEYNNLPYAEIAEILEVPLGTIKSRMFVALRKLRERLRGKV